MADGNDNLYLLANRVNTVGVKKVYANGKESETKYYNIYPDEGYIRGEISKEPESLIFTPEAGATQLTVAVRNKAIEAFSGGPVTLELRVRVRRNWRRDEASLDRMGV